MDTLFQTYTEIHTNSPLTPTAFPSVKDLEELQQSNFFNGIYDIDIMETHLFFEAHFFTIKR
jgi:hypothetical protein